MAETPTRPEIFAKAAAVHGLAQTRIPDALRVPVSWRGGDTNKFKRANHLFDATEPLLGVGHGQAHARAQGQTSEYFITRSPFCTLLFPEDHPTKAKTPRYDWEPMPELGDNVFFGYLKPEALELDGQFDPEKREALKRERDLAYERNKQKWADIAAKPAEQRTPDEERWYQRHAFVFDPNWQSEA